MRVYRCNPRCYNAISRECRCQCNGENHGVGEIQARANCSRLGIPLKTAISRRVSARRRRIAKSSVGQGRLFPQGRYWATQQHQPDGNFPEVNA
jgi:hypothetical protein